jgi:hypothetical protein
MSCLNGISDDCKTLTTSSSKQQTSNPIVTRMPLVVTSTGTTVTSPNQLQINFQDFTREKGEVQDQVDENHDHRDLLCDESDRNPTCNKRINNNCIKVKVPAVSVSQVGNGKGKSDRGKDSFNVTICERTVCERAVDCSEPGIGNNILNATSNVKETSYQNERASCVTPTLYFGADDWTFNYKGILLPKLNNEFKDGHLESAYQRYSQRQRQKSLVILNLIDILLKLVLLLIYALSDDSHGEKLKYRIFYNLPWFMVNLAVICLITCWKQFANNYLHLGAIFTWIIFNIQGHY